MSVRVKTFGVVDERSRRQLETCMKAGDADFGVLCADHHPGYSQPIGAAIAYEGYVSPSGVGYDIGCGNKAVRTDLTRAELGDVGRVMDEITKRVAFGMGVPARERVDHPVLDEIERAAFEPQRKLAPLARKQLGTVGGGNHYINLFADEGGQVWIGVHFGSRGFGFKTAAGFLALAEGLPFDEDERKRLGVRPRQGEMDSPPVLFDVGSEIGESYVEAMELAGRYVYAGRDVVVEKVLEILGARATHEVHNHHNFAWREQHGGRTYWVVRKGCTPAEPGQEGFVGATMGDDSVILEGADSADARAALRSTVHGAGRVMSRSQAAGRVKRRTVYECSDRDCDFTVPAKEYGGERCPAHPNARMRKQRRETVVRQGAVDWPAVRARLREQGIVLVGGGPDEAPEVYKDLNDVLAAHAGTIRVRHVLKPLGVAMAGAEVFDPYKD
jgi:tRNA-splicing ligase RtcB